MGLGRAILNSVEATQHETGTNVNLGIALLMAPLAAVPDTVLLPTGTASILNETTIEDAEHVYAAIRLAKPGGMGKATSQDVQNRPTVSLRDAMALAADRDRIAEQYVTDFAFVTGLACHWLVEAWHWCHDLKLIIPQLETLLQLPGIVPWEAAVIRLQLKMLADSPDSLVARKCGWDVAADLQQRAADLHRLDWPARINSWPVYHQFDEWLRADGHRRNPGTTADLIAATLFVALREGLIEPPSRVEVLEHAAKIRRLTAGRNSP
jgi:triphosphoribosyl-dephospho-CoA synthase